MDREKLFTALQQMEIEPFWFETQAAASEFLCGTIVGKKVVFGGSMTARDMGLFESLAEKNEVFTHWITKDAALRKQAEKAAEVYVCSVNGLSETGEIVNIDGTVNRVANSIYSKEKVVFVAGVNKVEPTLEKAIWRARNVSAPLNARRTPLNTPCSAGDPKCHNCNASDRICRVMSIIMRRPKDVKVMQLVLIGENLGF